MSEKLFRYATEAKRFMQEAGEVAGSDEIVMRAATVYGMLERRGMLAKERIDDGMVYEEVVTRAHAIALIAHGFYDYPPSTPERAALFAHKIETSGGGQPPPHAAR